MECDESVVAHLRSATGSARPNMLPGEENMDYNVLFQRSGRSAPVRAGVIGVGEYGTAVLSQAQAIPLLRAPIVADVDLQAARTALARAGVRREHIAECDNRRQALAALEAGRTAIVQDAMLLMDLPLDIIVESTGVPEAGARFASQAIGHGKHVAMVNKEADAVVGPYLKHLADRAGVVYTAVDGDQHGLIMDLVSWARAIGLEVICAGKARTTEFIYDPATRLVTAGAASAIIDAGKAWAFEKMSGGKAAQYLAARHAALAGLPLGSHSDVSELAIVANGAGLQPDAPELHRGVLRTVELPEALAPVEDGGILQRRGAIEMITTLRTADEAGLGGGVFVTVACANDYSRHILTSKGLIANSRGTTAVIYRPHHLCGVETPLSILAAVLLGVPTSSAAVRPVADQVMRAARDLSAGVILNEFSRDIESLLVPAFAVTEQSAVPLGLLSHNRLKRSVVAGNTITMGDVERPAGSVLWSLREAQDALFADALSA